MHKCVHVMAVTRVTSWGGSLAHAGEPQVLKAPVHVGLELGLVAGSLLQA
jgi:hypothetical protein